MAIWLYVFFQVVIICVLVLVQIDLIHFEHTKCISSTSIKTNTYPLHLRSIHTILCYIEHVIQIIPETPISVSGHETRSTAIPKLGKTRISVSGHETQSNRLYGSTTIQSLLFLKNIENFVDFLNNTYWVSLFLRNSLLIFWTGVSCFSVTLFYSTFFC